MIAFILGITLATITPKPVVDRLPATCVAAGERATFEARKGIARIIEREFEKIGIVREEQVVAILVNAWCESRWNPRDVSGPNVGLFQLSSRGVGRGFSRGVRQDPKANISILAATISFKKWTKEKGSAGTLSYLFAKNVERCSSRYHHQRRVMASKWYSLLKR